MTTYSTNSLSGKLILFATILASGMAFLDGSVVNIAIPSIQHGFSATITDMQWVINSYALTLCALILISGALGDTYGRKKIFITGMIVFLLASTCCGFAQTSVLLILFRALQGIGAAMMIPGSLSIINTSFDESVRGKAIGMWSGFAGGIAALGPFVGGWLVQNFGWPYIFFINIPLGLLALFLTVRFVPESKNEIKKPIDSIGALLLLVSLTSFSFGLISAPDMGWTNTFVLSSFVIGVVSGILFIISQKKGKYPLIPFSLFQSPLVVGANLVTFFLYFALSGVIFFLVLNFQQIQHYSPIFAGLGLLPTILIITFLSGYGGSIADKIGPRLPMMVGPLLVSLGMFLLAISPQKANYMSHFLPGLILFGIGMALVIAPLTKSALSVSQNLSGAASGVNNAVSRIAGLFAIALLGGIVMFFFQANLKTHLESLHLSSEQTSQILSQENKMVGIEIPKSFSPMIRNAVQEQIEESFMIGFRYVMLFTSGLALLSAYISFLTIHSPKKEK